jgi:hypothetical protein
LQKFVVSGIKGTLKITDAAPTVQGLYRLSDIGTYTNLGGLVTTAGKINDAYFNGTAWSKVEVAIQSGKSAYEVAVANGFVGTEAQWLASLKGQNKINTWTAKTYNAGEQVLYGGVSYEAGESVLATDIPGISSKWIKKIFYKSSIYDESAAGVNIPKLSGIKDLIIKNPQAGLFYTVTSVINDGTNIAINIFSATDNAGANLSQKTSFSFPVNMGYATATKTSATGEHVTIIVNTNEFHVATLTTMWAKDYKLHDNVFKDGVSSHDIRTQQLLTKTDFNFPFQTISERATMLNSVIREMYILGEPQDVKLTLIRKNHSTLNTEISLWNGTVTTKLGEYKSSTPVSGLKVIAFTSGNVVIGYALIDWDKIADNYNESSPTTNSSALLSNKIFSIENNPIIYGYTVNNNFDKLEGSFNKDNLIEDAELENRDYIINTLIPPNSENYSELIYDSALKANVIRRTRIVSGYGLGFTINLEYLRNKFKIGDWVTWGMWIKLKPATTGDAVGMLRLAINGLATSGYIANGNKTNTDWQWVVGKAMIDKIDSVISLDLYVEQRNITDWSKDNGLTVYASKFFLKTYKTQSEIPVTEVYRKPFKDIIKNYVRTEMHQFFSKYYSIGNNNNEFYFDDAQIDHLTSRFIGLIPNFNLPHTKNYGFISTDIMNHKVLDGNSTDFDWMKAKSPSFIYDGKRRGCMVLFDETGAAYIINQNGEKKFITLNS